MDPTALYGYRIEAPHQDGPMELHVLARAYRDAWIALHFRKPAGRHRIGGLDVAITFADSGKTG